MKIKLVIKKENEIIDTIEIVDFPFHIGRAESCNLALADQHISRVHATLHFKEDEIVIEKRSKAGKLLIDGKDIEKKQSLSLPCAFEIPPYALSLEMPKEEVLEAAGSMEQATPEEEPESFPVLLDEKEKMEEASFLEKPLEETKISKHKVRAKLILLEGKSPHESYDLVGSEITPGRDEACDIFIDDEKISREHAKIYQKNKTYYLEDLKSTNGTHLNHQKISNPTELTSSDQIQIGNATLQFAFIDEDAFALSSVTQETHLSSDTTYGELPSYHYPKQARWTPRTKILGSLVGIVFLMFIYFQFTPHPEPKRETATEAPTAQKEKPVSDELSYLTQVDQQYVLAKIEEAKNAYKNRNYEGAKIALGEALKIAPQYTQAKKLLEIVAQTLAQQKRAEGARQAQLEEEKLKEDIKLRLSVALDYFNRGQWEKALDVYDKILELNPEHTEASEKRKLAEEKLYKKPEIKPQVSQRQTRNKEAERFLAEGSQLNQKNEPLKALQTWRKVMHLENIDPSYYAKAEQFINFTKERLDQKYFPLMTQAKGLVESKEYIQAKAI